MFEIVDAVQGRKSQVQAENANKEYQDNIKLERFNSNSGSYHFSTGTLRILTALNSQGQDRILAECAFISTTSAGSLTPRKQ